MLRPLSGKPLLAYTADAVLRSRRIARAVLTTGSAPVAEAAEEFGFELAPPDSLEATAAEIERAEGRSYDAVILLPAVHPLRTASDIDAAIHLLESSGADAVATFTMRPPSAARLARLDAQGRVHPQAVDLTAPRLYVRDESVTCLRRSHLSAGGEVSGCDCRASVIPAERSCAVEDDFDFFLAEQLLQYERRASA